MPEIIARSLCGDSQSDYFRDPNFTASGQPRARVAVTGLRTLWFNTGTLCNLSCSDCYIESSPRNDRLAYLLPSDLVSFVEESQTLQLPLVTIGFTGGEPFMNPDMLELLTISLSGGYRVLVLTNATRPMMKRADGLLELNSKYTDLLTIRVSLDHYRPEQHEASRGPHSWKPTLKGLKWLSDNQFDVCLAGRLSGTESESELREGFSQLLHSEEININAMNAEGLVLFPDICGNQETPEISVDCWEKLGVKSQDMMCASSRMIVRYKNAKNPSVISCTLLPYEPEFDLGDSLASAMGDVPLNHPYCSRFCVLGGGKCSN